MPSVRSKRAPIPQRQRSHRDHCGSQRHTSTFKLADLGVYGFDRHETTILAALVTEDPLLLVGAAAPARPSC